MLKVQGKHVNISLLLMEKTIRSFSAENSYEEGLLMDICKWKCIFFLADNLDFSDICTSH